MVTPVSKKTSKLCISRVPYLLNQAENSRRAPWAPIVRGLGFRVWGLGFGLWALRFRAQGLGFD